MAGTMVNPPEEACYSFDVNRGSLCDPFGRTWHPINPDYDPGPPPPPRPPKEKKERKGEMEARAEADAEKPRVPKQLQQPYRQPGEGVSRGRHWLGEAVPGSSSEQTNRRHRPIGDRAEVSRGRGRGRGPGPIRQPRGRGQGRGGGRIGTFDKCVRGLLRTLRCL